MTVKQAFTSHPGKHYVLYNDGNKSKVMPKRYAKDYADVLGGVVYRHPAFPTLCQRISSWFGKKKKI